MEDTVGNIQGIQPSEIKAGKNFKGMSTGKDFNSFLGATEAFGPAAAEATRQYGDVSSGAVLGAAFSGVSAARGQAFAASNVRYQSVSGFGGPGGPSGFPAGGGAPVFPNDTAGFSTSDLLNSMNQNNLHLLELQATMQSNMQEWNTKSNILSADHRARMAMIEKFTARG